ncbi:MAG: SDR family NAD(P)-dependent oxidoreductase [Alphaproteobacteria bacterium]|jgi:short-subunit dehydrogenase|nr:SDR family NAD(P)-dependent oxidoreductase [Alphaproteobacteria bacterium]
MRISGSLSVISGSSSGIGEATARLLAAKGSHVVLLARDAAGLHEVEADIRSKGGRADAYVIDLADAKAIAATAARIIAEQGSPDILFNCAGAGRWLPLLETSAEEAAAMMALPYLAAFNLTRELLPCMLERGSGQIVNITSVASRLAWPGAVAYTAARAAMEGFTNALRADVQRSGVSVMLATFGTVETPYWKNNPGSRTHMPKTGAARIVLTREQVADAIVRGIERGQREIIQPAIFRLLFALNAFFPAAVARYVARQ